MASPLVDRYGIPPSPYRRYHPPHGDGSRSRSGPEPKLDYGDGPAAHSEYEWKPGFLKRVPWITLCAVVAVGCSAAACAVVLWQSDGKNTEEWWYVRPPILLAIFAMVANGCIRFILSEGLPVAWWTGALRARTIARLHTDWVYGTSVRSALSGVFKGSLVAFATIAATAVAVDGPLLQRASSTKLARSVPVTAAVNITIATQLPFGYTGMDFAGDVGSLAERPLMTPWSLPVVLGYTQGKAISAATASGCKGVCEGTLEAAGLWRDCDLSEEQLDFGARTTDVLLRGRQLFAVDWSLVTSDLALPASSYYPGYGMSALEPGMNEAIPTDEPYVSMNVTWSPFAVSRKRTIYTRKCRLYSARSHYPVRIQNDTQDATISSAYNITSNIITLTGPSEPIEGSVQNVRKVVAETGLPIKVDPQWVKDGADTNQTLSILRPLTYFQGEGVCEEYPNAVGCPVYLTLGGLASAAADLLGANVTGMHLFGGNLRTSLSGALSNQFITYSDEINAGGNDVFGLNTGWDDPTSYIFGVLDELMFRLAIDSAYKDTLQNVSFGYIGSSMSDQTAVPDRNTSSKYKMFPQPQLVQMSQVQTIQVYESNYWYLLGAAGAMIVCAVVVLPLFSGFWVLGRAMSFSPIEIAKAFGSPQLDGANSNADAAGIVKVAGPNLLRYGEVSGESKQILRFGPPESTFEPRKGASYG